MDRIYQDLATAIIIAASSHSKDRFIVAVAGPPGSGKTTVASEVVQLLNRSSRDSAIAPLALSSPPAHLVLRQAPGSVTSSALAAKIEPAAIAISMDGFHLSRSTLDLLPNASEAHTRRGAPWTFDVGGIINLVRRLQESTSIPSTSREPIFAPIFDHELKDPVADGTVIGSAVSIIILEGNYLLLDENEWREISKLVDLRVFIDVDYTEARNRVSRRHVAAGIEATIEEGERRFDGNDGVNGFLIKERMIEPNITIKSIVC